MTDELHIKSILNNLNERKKELNCIYQISEILNKVDQPLATALRKVIELMPYGWQYSDNCTVQIIYDDEVFHSPQFVKSDLWQESDLIIDDKCVGNVKVFYNDASLEFLAEEQQLLDTICKKLSIFLHRILLKKLLFDLEHASDNQKHKPEWKTIIELLRHTDSDNYLRIARKLMNYLFWIGRTESQCHPDSIECSTENIEPEGLLFSNKPIDRQDKETLLEQSKHIFQLAENNLDDVEILLNIQKWLQEDKLNFLTQTLEDMATSLSDIQNALERYFYLNLDKIELSYYTKKNLSVSLILRFFTDQLQFINIAKDFVDINYFRELTRHMIFPANSHGKLGGKSAGIFLAKSITSTMFGNKLHDINICYPNTWYITSNTMHRFLYYNNLEEIIEQKYKEIEQVRSEYANIIQLFKNSYFPPEIIKEFNRAIEDFGDNPIIVRSSSLLEDRVGAVFSGKYKSLFLANQGTRIEKINALADAVAEVYASVFSPDPIEYRRERGLLDFHEEMAIIIQQVVGKKVGDYFLPAFAGVAFSHNEFRWSPRIKQDDGLIRIVPGLGTRAVDRLSDDYPILIAPGQPDLRVNITPDEVCRYSPHKIDVINLKKNTFETIEIKKLLKEYGDEYPMADKILSFYENGDIRNLNKFQMNFASSDPIVTFHGLNHTSKKYVSLIGDILTLLKRKTDAPVDIEFACDGDDFYLLQCRAQSSKISEQVAAIPKDVPQDQILFSANRFIANGYLPEITHIVYVTPQGYSSLTTLEDMKSVARAVGKINKLLPKRKFILMGPGRWGSRGDIKLGVSVTYSDINNTAVLIEIARKKGHFTSDLSFGTHFFQDLVESNILYLPLYPDEENNVFNNRFLNSAENILPDIAPEFAYLSDTIRVIDIPATCDGKVLKILMNADLDEALAHFAPRNSASSVSSNVMMPAETVTENHWLWRQRIAEKIASMIKAELFGVQAMYIFGSVKNANAGPASDIDLLLHFTGDDQQRRELLNWLQGWSLCLSEMNYLRTGYKTDGLLDVHLITDKDIAAESSYAVKINAVTDSAKPLKMED
ncbi:MAG: PEP/pyruvate-binding domain-containing protein [Candidatus Stygibacter australis]|nr:PEP/pyruvate-binding domain-containing protein [Candidatus Stygibacter australis]MDP8323384.1 PEP/pyruvate-binding domain-containing protein [Candidatus Stygibacter australis]